VSAGECRDGGAVELQRSSAADALQPMRRGQRLRTPESQNVESQGVVDGEDQFVYGRRIAGDHPTPQVFTAKARNLKLSTGESFCDNCWEHYFDHKDKVYSAMLSAYWRQEKIVYDRDDRPLTTKESKELWSQLKKQYLQ